MSFSHPSHSGAAASLWPETDWDKVLALRDPAAHQAALGEICQTYREVFLRVLRKWDPLQAEDMTQDFLLGLIKRDSMQRIDPSLGKFRQYVGRMLSNFARKHHRHQHRQKRGEGIVHVEISEDVAADEPPDTDVFDHEWARALVARVVATFKADGTRPETLRMALRELVTQVAPAASYAELAAQTGVLETTLRSEVARARARFYERLKQEVALTTVRSELDTELAYVLRALEAGPANG